MSSPVFPAVAQALKSLARPAVHLARELPLRADLARNRGDQPLVAFLPCEGPVGAARLRVYNIAAALAPDWRALVLPATLTLTQRKAFLARARPDVLVMQGARHALNRPAFYPGVPIVYDMDDADFHLPHLCRPVREAMTQVDVVTAGSRYIAQWCRSVGAGQVEVVWTGAPVSSRPAPPQESRPLVIAWAQTCPQSYRREADMVREVSARLAARHPGLVLRLYDRQKEDDPSFANSFAVAGLRVEWIKAASYRNYLGSLDDVALGLAPLCPESPFSRGKSFGKVLAYLDRSVPVLAADVGEHGAFFNADQARSLGVVSNDVDVWVKEGARLLGDSRARAQMAGEARAAFETHLSVKAAASQLARILRRLVAVKLKESA